MRATSTIVGAAGFMTLITTAIAGGIPLTQAEAEACLSAAGIVASSSDGCTDKNHPRCTSYEGILSDTASTVIRLKQASHCPFLVITGGTEVGHAPGLYSHGTGHKVDLRRAPCLDYYIKDRFTRIGNRGDGYPQWMSHSGNIYCEEGNHWDALVI